MNENGSLPQSGGDGPSIERGLADLCQRPEFRGPIESFYCHDDEPCQHVGLIYDTDEKRQEAVATFLCQGLARGERCLYVGSESGWEECLRKLRTDSIDVDRALRKDLLTYHSFEETYLRHEPFDATAVLDHYEAIVKTALEDYPGVRITAEASWLARDSVAVDDALVYECLVNELEAAEDCLALCQYDRRELPANTIRELIRTHPYLIIDGTVCHNVYYIPPDEYLGDPQPEGQIHRLLDTLVERTHAKTTLQDHLNFIHECYEVTSNPDVPFADKVERLLRLGCRHFGTEVGGLTRITGDDQNCQYDTIIMVDAADGGKRVGRASGERSKSSLSAQSGWQNGHSDDSDATGTANSIAEEFGLVTTYETIVSKGRSPYGILWFGSSRSRDGPLNKAEQTFLDVIGQWVSYELDRDHREAQLSALNEMSRDLMTVKTAEEIATFVVDHLKCRLEFPATAIVRYDESGELALAAKTDEATESLPIASLCETEDSPAWDAFIANQARLLDDVDSSHLTEVLIMPIGKHGVSITGTTASRGFSDTEREFLETTAATLEAAFSRADRETLLYQRERTLATKTEDLERLNRINRTIRAIDQVLVSATTRAEIEAAVCEKLTESGPYELALIGEADPANNGVTASEWAGSDGSFIEAMYSSETDTPAGMDVTSRAIQDNEPQVINNILNETNYHPWGKAALRRGYHAYIALPLTYDDTTFGVLSLYAGQPEAFDAMERDVLVEMSHTIAYAINAVERKKALVSDEVTELVFDITETSMTVVELCTEFDCEIDLEGLVVHPDGRLRIFFVTRGIDASTLFDLEYQLHVSKLTLVSEDQEDDTKRCLFEAIMTEESVIPTIVNHGGVTKSWQVSGEAATMTVELAGEVETREFVEMFQTKYPRAKLQAQRTLERPLQSQALLQADLTDALTDRQLEVLHLAYFGGYFDTPRARTASELAATLDITQPTFNHHLRAAMQAISQQLFTGPMAPGTLQEWPAGDPG